MLHRSQSLGEHLRSIFIPIKQGLKLVDHVDNLVYISSIFIPIKQGLKPCNQKCEDCTNKFYHNSSITRIKTPNRYVLVYHQSSSIFIPLKQGLERVTFDKKYDKEKHKNKKNRQDVDCFKKMYYICSRITKITDL